MIDDGLIGFLRDVMGRVMPFSSIVSHVHLKQLDDGRLLAKASATDGTICFSSTSKLPISFSNSRACLGNLPYLHQLLGSAVVKPNQTQVNISSRERNDRSIVSSMTFVPNNRMELTYIATDPFRASIIKPIEIIITEWPIAFILDTTSIKEIGEFKKINSAAPDTGGEAIIVMSFTDGGISIDFGIAGSQSSSLRLEVEAISETEQTISINLLADQFQRALIQSTDNTGMIEAYLTDKALMLKSTNSIADHEIMLIHRRTRDMD